MGFGPFGRRVEWGQGKGMVSFMGQGTSWRLGRQEARRGGIGHGVGSTVTRESRTRRDAVSGGHCCVHMVVEWNVQVSPARMQHAHCTISHQNLDAITQTNSLIRSDLSSPQLAGDSSSLLTTARTAQSGVFRTPK
jgi:hypothetical protein